MGCGTSKTLTEAEKLDWPLKAEATRIFNLADVDSNGTLDIDELATMLRTPKFAENAMEHMDLVGRATCTRSCPASPS